MSMDERGCDGGDVELDRFWCLTRGYVNVKSRRVASVCPRFSTDIVSSDRASSPRKRSRRKHRGRSRTGVNRMRNIGREERCRRDVGQHWGPSSVDGSKSHNRSGCLVQAQLLVLLKRVQSVCEVRIRQKKTCRLFKAQYSSSSRIHIQETKNSKKTQNLSEMRGSQCILISCNQVSTNEKRENDARQLT